MTLGEQARWWAVAALGLLLFLYAFSSAVTPFLAGMAIAYFLDPLADRLEARGLSRLAATVVITGLAVTVATLAALLLVPLLIDQIGQVVRAAPQYIAALQGFVERQGATWAPEAFGEGGVLDNAFGQFETQLRDWSLKLLESAWTGGLALVDAIALAVITPVVAFYMLLDWDRMVDEIDHWLPRRHAPAVRQIAADVDGVLAGFVRGQLTVCMILGTFYAIALVALGLSFGLVVGLFAGLISFVPFIGSIIGGALSIGIAVFQFWDDPIWIGAVAAVFLAGQAVEGNYLTPKLVGGSVGLHPVWLMFALSAFGSVMGFVGLLIAVPLAAVLGVLARFALEQYRLGRLYSGGEPMLPDDPDHERDHERALGRAQDRAGRQARQRTAPRPAPGPQ